MWILLENKSIVMETQLIIFMLRKYWTIGFLASAEMERIAFYFVVFFSHFFFFRNFLMKWNVALFIQQVLNEWHVNDSRGVKNMIKVLFLLSKR